MRSAFVLDVALDLVALMERAVKECESDPLNASQEEGLSSDLVLVHPAPAHIWHDHDKTGEDDAKRQVESSQQPPGKKLKQ